MSPKHLVAAAIVFTLGAPASAQTVKAGIEAWQHADYSTAVAIWRPLAQKGDADAEFNLGQAYRLGRGVSINLAIAKSWFEKAANSGHLDAETTLGLLLFQNGDQAAGMKWLKQAAEQGEPRALLVYGTALYNGDGVSQDKLLGYAYVARAADEGLAPAKDTLAQLDDLLPAADRAKAAALSHSIPKGPSQPQAKTVRPVQFAKAKPVPVSPTPKASLAPKPLPAPKPSKVKAAEPPAAKPAPQLRATGNWRIQLGAFAERSSAEALYQRLSNKAVLMGRSPSFIGAGKVTRLQIGPFASREAAAAACRELGSACFPVQIK